MMATFHMNRLGASLLGAVAVAVFGFGIERIVYWASLPLGPVFGAGEMFGLFVGIVIAALGAGAGLTARGIWNDRRRSWILGALWAALLAIAGFVALTTPGPPPIPRFASVGAVAVGLTVLVLALARWISRRRIADTDCA